MKWPNAQRPLDQPANGRLVVTVAYPVVQHHPPALAALGAADRTLANSLDKPNATAQTGEVKPPIGWKTFGNDAVFTDHTINPRA